MRVYFIRHGEAEHNVAFQRYGERAYKFKELRFSKLTEKGKFQAMSINPDEIRPDIVYTSSLPRTLQTTDLIFGSTCKVYVADFLRECNFHHRPNERKTKIEIRREYPHFNTMLIDTDEDIVFHEELDDLESRINEVFMTLQELNRNGAKSVVFVSHGDFIMHCLEHTGIKNKILDHCEPFLILM